MNGWTEIGSSEERINLKSVLATFTDNEILDPEVASDSEYSGYDICRSFDSERFVLNAPKSELSTIEVTKKIMIKEENITQ